MQAIKKQSARRPKSETTEMDLLLRLRNAQRKWKQTPVGRSKHILLERKKKIEDEVDAYLRKQIGEVDGYFFNKNLLK